MTEQLFPSSHWNYLELFSWQLSQKMFEQNLAPKSFCFRLANMWGVQLLWWYWTALKEKRRKHRSSPIHTHTDTPRTVPQYTHTHTHTPQTAPKYTHTHTHSPNSSQIHTHTHTHTYTHTHILYTHTHTHTHTAQTAPQYNTHTHIHTYTHMHAHTHTHTHTHTYTHTPQQFPNTLTSVTANARRIQTSTVDTATAEGVEAVMEAARAALSVMSWPGVHRPRAGSLCQPVNHPLAWRIRQAWQGSAT